MRRKWLAGLLVAVLTVSVLSGCAQKKAASPAPADKTPVADGPDVAERRVRQLVLLSRPQSQAQDEFEFTKLLADEMNKIGIPTKIAVTPWEQMMNVVWYTRDKWDFTGWSMVGRPERLDPDEFSFNLFHSSTAKDGFNFIGFNDPAYDKLAEEQRSSTDQAKRAELVKQIQKKVADSAPYLFIAHPKMNYAYNSDVFSASTVVDMKGIGIKNFWTFVTAKPTGAKKDEILNTNQPVTAINPLYIAGGADSWVYELVWDRLMRVGPDGLPQPWAAEKVEWKDTKTLDVTVRQGMKWHDGRPVTLDDVMFSFTAAMGTQTPMYKPFVSNIDTVEKTGENKLTFRLKAPSAAFLTATLSKINLIPKHIWEPALADLKTKNLTAEKFQEKTPIGSGPFKFTSWKLNEEIVLQANGSHWAKPNFDRWILRSATNSDAALGMLESGEINFLADYGGDPTILAQKATAKPNIKVVASVDVGSRFIGMNERRPPFDDVAFRQALQYLVNRPLIVDMVYKGAAVPQYGMISPPLGAWFNSDLTSMYPYDPAKAKATLQKAGYEWDAAGHILYPKGKKETTPAAQ